MVKVAAGTAVLAVSTATDTIYAPNAGSSFNGDTMSVINGATCNGTNHSGCSHLAATVKVGSGPFGVAVDDRTHTVYVVNNADGDAPGTVSVINGATCNGTDTSGCRQHFPTMATGRSPLLAAVDARHRHRLRHRFLQRRGVDPGRIKVQRLGDQRMRRRRA